ncbi:unnamed protein product [Lupinus luteus]|uniref:Chalcone synthase n=1 Tax=Lupinus luteus TaxID=3873 RepID=A0AAV1X177_LUPLU
MVSVEEIRNARRAEGPATIMAVGTATPSNCVDESTYPDFYFRVTNSVHKIELKKKFKRMYARQDMVVVEVPRLGKEAATKAIKEWGQPKSKITHLIFCTTSGVDMPGAGADYQLTKLLGLRPYVKRYMMYQQGCFAGGTVLRLDKDLAENNKVTFRSPSETHLDSLVVGQALFRDGAVALIVGSDPLPQIERPLFELVWTAQTILPDSENIKKALVEAFQPLGISDYNPIFWIAHPGGPTILDQVELKLGLEPEKMRATRHVLSEYGNMSSACVLFIMDEMKNKSTQYGLKTTGEGLEWGYTNCV